MFSKIKSTLSTVASTLQAVRELPGAMKEAIAFTRENSETKRELAEANAQIDKGLNLHQEWMERCIARENELDLWRSWGRAITSKSVDLDDEQLRLSVSKRTSDIATHWSHVADGWRSECNELKTKLARYEATETWHQVTAGEGELPPEGVEVIGRFSEHSGMFVVKVRPDRDGIKTYQWRFASSTDVPC